MRPEQQPDPRRSPSIPTSARSRSTRPSSTSSAYETYYEEKRPFFIEGAEHLQRLRPGRRSTSTPASTGPIPSSSTAAASAARPQGVVRRRRLCSTSPTARPSWRAAKLTGKIGGLEHRRHQRPDRPRIRRRRRRRRCARARRSSPSPGTASLRAQKEFDRGPAAASASSPPAVVRDLDDGAAGRHPRTSSALGPGRRRLDLPRQGRGSGRRPAGPAAARGPRAAPQAITALQTLLAPLLPAARRRLSLTLDADGDLALRLGRPRSTSTSRRGTSSSTRPWGPSRPGFEANDLGYQRPRRRRQRPRRGRLSCAPSRARSSAGLDGHGRPTTATTTSAATGSASTSTSHRPGQVPQLLERRPAASTTSRPSTSQYPDPRRPDGRLSAGADGHAGHAGDATDRKPSSSASGALLPLITRAAATTGRSAAA
ncbi:MAG: hypothetical protein M0C28_00375 [Candidatus Moduliflexus flocculans]|nr:hypothetical protein [Candidatus Moduliflexus flocculans]